MADDYASFPGITDLQVLQFKMYYLVAFWLEATIYGLYVSLFVVALNIMLRRQALDTTSSRVFLTGITLMFVVITFHNSTNVYRMLFAYAKYDPVMPNRAVVVLLDWSNWDAYAFPICASIITWIGDILMIYRCFLIWKRNYWVVVVPLLALLTSIAATSVNFYWFRHPTSIPWQVMNRMFKITYPLNLFQNVLITGLIAFRLHRRYRKSSKVGFDASSRIGYIAVMRIVVESALIFTLMQAVMTILWYLNHPSIVIVQHMLPPSMGIVFVMIAIRAHIAKASSSVRRDGSHTINGIIPTWLTSRDETGQEPQPRSVPVRFVTSTVDEHHLEVLSPRKGTLNDFSGPDSPASTDYQKRRGSAFDTYSHWAK
ncbi:hypothetical protein FA13DRAFT_1737760 [Coprinellus micaceus]|uniref:Uncharacterized protein n=1 Tax=Coprinellus micaceus TaxID=71717 RepID=A0A4Y7SWU3_COPMI|nr:hypothetical protein FA13DRAFT_1737760 [Coprinellus micaceus]